jgi:hypothetical protein
MVFSQENELKIQFKRINNPSSHRLWNHLQIHYQSQREFLRVSQIGSSEENGAAHSRIIELFDILILTNVRYKLTSGVDATKIVVLLSEDGGRCSRIQ